MFDYVTTAGRAAAPDYDGVAMKPPCSRIMTVNHISNTGSGAGRNLRDLLPVCKHDWIPHVSREAASVSSSHNVDLTGLDGIYMLRVSEKIYILPLISTLYYFTNSHIFILLNYCKSHSLEMQVVYELRS